MRFQLAHTLILPIYYSNLPPPPQPRGIKNTVFVISYISIQIFG